MKKNRFKLKSISTNVRNIKAKKRSTHLLITAMWYLVPTVVRHIVTKHVFSPRRYSLTSSERKHLEMGEPFRIHVHGKAVQCWKWGQGPGILFVHGWNGRGVHFRHFFEEFINAGYAVIAYDAPAHGESGGQDTSYFELTDVVRAFLDPSLSLDIKGVIAHSLGASAVINCLAKENSSIDTVLLAPALKLRELLFNTFDSQGLPEVVYQTMIAELETYYGYHLYEDDPYTLLENVSSKIFIVHDRDDPTTPYMDSKTIAEKLNHVDLLTTEGLGHKKILRDKTVISTIQKYIIDLGINVRNQQHTQMLPERYPNPRSLERVASL
jgi:pimeloyl-ACP methyl ester carboxylesterase